MDHYLTWGTDPDDGRLLDDWGPLYDQARTRRARTAADDLQEPE